MRALVIVLFATAGFCSATRVAAQTDSCLRRVVPVNVVGTHGATFSDLSTDNFEASLHHKSVKIVSVTRDDSPRRIIVALDASGSMHDRWKGNLALARDLLESLRPNDEMGLVVFSDHIVDAVPLTQERGALSVELARLTESPAASPAGLTALWDSLESATGQFDTPLFGDSIFVLSDGEDNRSHVVESKFESSLIEKRIRLFGLMLAPDRWGQQTREPRVQYQLTDPEVNTGGFGVYFSSPPRRDESLPIVADASGRQTVVAMEQFQLHMIQTVEKVEIELPEQIQKPEQWRLSVHGVSDPHLRVAYPHTLVACANP